jgi:serine/threonine protein kinase
MNQIAMGMCNLHDMYVAHLDVKPDNVLVSSMTIAKEWREIVAMIL